ncbi:hypothetical protein ACIF83_33460 [Streptomyces sp. NPDC085866]|uniref:hypothetical protein n=1 Tax=Streptomyces sp. NPDC085866 TaxID=3365736 RepID=UPI0037CCFAD4
MTAPVIRASETASAPPSCTVALPSWLPPEPIQIAWSAGTVRTPWWAVVMQGRLKPTVRSVDPNPLTGLRDELDLGRLSSCHDPAVVRHFADRTPEPRDARVSSSRLLRSSAAAPR